MARETKTIQMYPDDDAINQAISLWENFGWEVIGNQRCQNSKSRIPTVLNTLKLSTK